MANLATFSASKGMVCGSGSNVVDLFYRVRSIPQAGAKQYFAGKNVLEGEVVGGESCVKR